MRKKIAILMVALLLIGGLVAATIYLQKNPEAGTADIPQVPVDVSEKEPSLPEQTTYVLGGEEPADILLIHLENAAGTYSVLATENEEVPYEIESLNGLRLVGVESLFRSAGALPAQQVLGQPEDLSQYGLTAPAAKVTVDYKKSGPVTLLLGDMAPGGASRYVKLEKEPSVYVVEEASVAPFFLSSLEYVNRNLVPGSPDTMQFSHLSLGGALREAIEISLLPEEEQTEYQGVLLSSHQMVAPFASDLDYAALEGLSTLFGLTADRVVAVLSDDTVLEEFGLEMPYSTVAGTAQLRMAEENGEQSTEAFPFSLSFSQPDATGQLYAMSDGVPAIFQLSAEALPWLSYTSFDVMSKMVLLPYIDTVAEIGLETPEGTDTFVLTHTPVTNEQGETEEELSVTLNGTPLDVKAFRGFYQTLLSTRYDSPLAKESQEGVEEAMPRLTLTYTYREGETDVIHFYDGGARRLLVQLNDGPLYFEMERQLETILNEKEALLHDQ